MYNLIVCDLDDTLARSKTVIDSEMAKIIEKLLEKKKLAVISGGNFKQFERELLFPLSLTCNFMNLHLFPTDGTAYYTWSTQEGRWQIVYEEALSQKEKIKILDAFSKILLQLNFNTAKHSGELIEDRISSMTFSGLGQNAELSIKEAWDPDRARRIEMKKLLDPLLSDFEVRIAGTTSIDITRKGHDKAYGIKKMIEYIGIPLREMIYIGDSLFPEGNDAPVIATNIKTISVKDPEETKKILQDLMEK